MIQGNYDQSSIYWNNVLKLCPNYDAAYINLARTDIQNKEYSNALHKLIGTGNLEYYSDAFKGIREMLIRNNFTFIFVGIFVLIALTLILKFIIKKYHGMNTIFSCAIIKEYRFSNHCMFHPFDGFWDLKREKRGSLRAANLLMLAFIFMYALRTQYSGYIFTGKLSSKINILYEIVKIILPLLLWCVSNWSFTTLMDGEGSLKDIYVATSYALKPYIITAIPLFILSHCLSADEAFIYTSLSTIVIIWTLSLIFLGMMVTHDYSMIKAIVTLVLTLIGICLILFLGMVFSNIIQDIFSLCSDIYKEMTYRLY